MKFNSMKFEHIASIYMSPSEGGGTWLDCIHWCKDNLDVMDWNYMGEGVFEFRNKQDYVVFLLKWSQ